jgi:uncharacterized membrane protein YgcG
MPVVLEKGTYGDFGNDNWYVADDTTGLPTMAVGRVPGRTAAAITSYVNKLLAYEAGTKSPNASFARQLAFVSDSDTMSEDFYAKSTALSDSVVLAQPGYSTYRIDRTLLGSDAATKTAILDAFNEGPLVINYLGHGAENLWAGSGVFENTDASALSNSKLPFVMALNCRNAYFYDPDPDPSLDGLGEKLIFNPSGGAVAFVGSTAFTNPNAQIAIAKAFYNILTQQTRQAVHTVRFGDILLAAKISVGSNTAAIDAIKSYTLLGDPTSTVPSASFTGDATSIVTPPSSSTSSGNSASGASSGGGKSGGFLGCGTIFNAGNGSSNDGHGGNGAVEFGSLAIMLAMIRLLINRRLVLNKSS